MSEVVIQCEAECITCDAQRVLHNTQDMKFEFTTLIVVVLDVLICIGIVAKINCEYLKLRQEDKSE